MILSAVALQRSFSFFLFPMSIQKWGNKIKGCSSFSWFYSLFFIQVNVKLKSYLFIISVLWFETVRQMLFGHLYIALTSMNTRVLEQNCVFVTYLGWSTWRADFRSTGLVPLPLEINPPSGVSIVPDCLPAHIAFTLWSLAASNRIFLHSQRSLWDRIFKFHLNAN